MQILKLYASIFIVLLSFIDSSCVDAFAEKEQSRSLPHIDTDYKAAINLKKKQIETSDTKDKGLLTAELAILLYKDQDQEQAFKTFLQALEYRSNDTPSISVDKPQNEQSYQNALSIYLDSSGLSSKEKSKKILENYEERLKANPDSHLLAYLVAIAKANLGLYVDFFNLFYGTYQFYPEHFLAYKTKAILHIKLFERARTPLEKETQREKILKNLTEALNREPQDETIYKLMITFASPDKKKAQVRDALSKILNENIIISRGDLLFFIQEATQVHEEILAKQLLEKARSWYQKSKIINSAQNYLDAHMQRATSKGD